VEFTLLGRKYVGLNGGPNVKSNDAVSFMVVTETQQETDRYWDAIVGKGGAEGGCGWCNDRWGFSWQITPKLLLDSITSTDQNAAKRAFEVVMTKINIAGLEAVIKRK